MAEKTKAKDFFILGSVFKEKKLMIQKNYYV
ncbi:hypothetical protein SAMN06295945_0420 [Polynucleobacter meluiroseus]|uniref:Uncharacterized protein n=1 Tax=Polynucleobacter meluiroseus TaxID=1938814 RepID=A0A240DY25_9BURK|nr:hypothetical protein SAMN06295945_0420 [Polynucleobacter meluiroseus]